MVSGLLEVHGTLDVGQFWPTGRSDADTATVTLNAVDPFRFRKHASAPFKATRVFDNATVSGQTSKPAIKNGKVTIRFEHIDATELHFEPTRLSKKEKAGLSAAKLNDYHLLVHFYRQLLGASAAKALHDLVAGSGSATIACRVVTQVDTPNEVFDTFGRLIGNIEITMNGKMLNLNQWLVEQGWAFPTFYSSATNQEITSFSGLAKTARSQQKGVWKFLSKTVGPFDFNLREPKKNDTGVLTTDKGPVIFPKLYRRYTSWSARNKAKVTNQTFQKFLAAGSNGRPDGCFVTADFLANGVHSAHHRTFDEFVDNGKIVKFEPAGLVFTEKPSILLGPNKQPIDQF